MKLAVMQPYLLPYPGYFQLIHAVDGFVIFDDVNYIPRGWVNRNRLLNNGEAQRFTLEVAGGSQNALINQVRVGSNRARLLKTVYHAYSKAPLFEQVYPLVENIFNQTETNLARFLAHGLRVVCDYLGLLPAWYLSSELAAETGLNGEDRILSICKQFGATHYVNLPGGRELYSTETFQDHGIKLGFIVSEHFTYRQFDKNFVDGLSIIDMLMFNDREQCRQLLARYRIDG